jgi:hypothetical protein
MQNPVRMIVLERPVSGPVGFAAMNAGQCKVMLSRAFYALFITVTEM